MPHLQTIHTTTAACPLEVTGQTMERICRSQERWPGKGWGEKGASSRRRGLGRGRNCSTRILALPVDSARTLVRLDVHLIVIDVDLGNVHFKVVGKELDGLPDGSYPGPARSLEHLLQGWQVCARSSGWVQKERERRPEKHAAFIGCFSECTYKSFL